jgi:HlyD family secretion protein
MKKIILLVTTCITLTACNNNESKYDAEGYFESNEITVSAESAGKIVTLNIEEGQEIEKGEKLGGIDSLQLNLQKMQLEKNAKSIKSNKPNIKKQIAAQEELIRKQKKEQQRISRLMQDGAATPKQLDDINSQIAVLESQLSAQKSTLLNSTSSINAQSSSVELQMAQIDDKISKCNITSPIKGTILTKYAEAGEFANIGKPLFKVADMNNVYLRAYITSAQIGKLKIGQHTDVYADYGGKNKYKYDGIITWISQKS